MSTGNRSVRAAFGWHAARGWLVMVCFGLLPSVAMPAPAGWNLREQISESAWIWARPQEYGLPGVRIRAQNFDVFEEPAQAARRLASLLPARFSRLQFSGPSLWLSGVVDGEHWLAHLRKTSTGTTGVVSSLAPGGGAGGPGRSGSSALVPCQAVPVVEMISWDPVPASVVRVECPGATHGVLNQLRHRLRSGRWKPADPGAPVSGTLARDWRHVSGATLSVLSETRPSSVVLTFWHRGSELRP